MSLSATGFGALRAAQAAMGLIIAGALAASAWQLWEARVLEEAAHPYEAATKRVIEGTGSYVERARQAGYDLSDQRLKDLEKEVAFTNQLLANRAFSWTQFLTDLEEAVPGNVSVASVGLSFNKEGVATITLAGAALTLRDLTVLANELEKHPAFQGVVLSHHQTRPVELTGRAAARLSQETVEFALTVTYRPR
jgi:hypothetical protein